MPAPLSKDPKNRAILTPVTLLESERAFLSTYGNGNIARGIRRLVKEARWEAGGVTSEPKRGKTPPSPEPDPEW